MKKTKIICTLGPASRDEKTIEKMLLSGMNVARINFSHGTHEYHKETIDTFRKVRDRLNLPAAVMLDTKGPEIRLRDFEGGKVTLKKGEVFTLTTKELMGNSEIASISYKDLPSQLTKGNKVLIDDGKVSLEVIETNDTDIKCKVLVGGEISNHKGINIPNVHLDFDYLSEQDKLDLQFGVKEDVDFVAASFVRSKDDVVKLRNYLDSIELKEDYNIEVTYKSIDRNVNSKEGNTIKGIVKGYANVTSKELTQFYLYLEEISAVRTPTMYGKNVKKTISKGKVYAQKFNQEDEKDNIIYLYNYEKNVDGKNWSKVETKTKEKNVGSSYTSYFDFYTEFYNELENFYEQAKKTDLDLALDINKGFCTIRNEKCILKISSERLQETYTFIKDDNGLRRIEYISEANDKKVEIVVKLVSKQKEVKTNAMRILESLKIPYTHHTYECEEFVDGLQIADKLSLPYEQVYKTLVTVSNSKNYFVFVIPIAAELDLKKAAKSVGEKSVEMIHVKDINAITGYIRGGCTAIGMKKQYVTRIDESAKTQEQIYVSGGKIGSQIRLTPEDLAKAAKAEFADIIRHEN